MSDCIFCKIIDKEIPSVVLYEDETLLVMMDIFPESEGHCLIIPKKHRENLYKMEDDLLVSVVKMSKRVACAVKVALSTDGVQILQFNEAAAGQTVFHYHMHVVPAYTDVVKGKHHSGEPEKPEILEKIAIKIKKVLNDEN